MSNRTLDSNRLHVKGVFFDLYGTLLTYGNMSKAWSDWLDSFYTQLSRCGLAISQTDFAACCDGFFSKKPPKIENNALTVFEHRIKNLCDVLDLAVGDDDIKTIASTSAAIWQKQIPLDPNAKKVLTELKKTKILGLITNFDHPPHIYDLIRREGLEAFFDVIIVSGEVEMKKPNPAIFHLALEKTGLDQCEVAYVGDTAEDIEGAIAASLIPIHIQRKVQVKNGNAYDFDSDENLNQTSTVSCWETPSDVCPIDSLLGLMQLLI